MGLLVCKSKYTTYYGAVSANATGIRDLYQCPIQISCTSSNDLPLVSGTILYTTQKDKRQQAEKNQKVTAGPAELKKIGVSQPTIVSATHMVMMLKAKALPLILVGKISEAITNFKGPIENAKHAKNRMMLITNAMLFVVPV